ncbi:MAG TPA: hypothetical protein VIM83_05490, partial [Candidatus Limnocylindria bacterium]
SDAAPEARMRNEHDWRPLLLDSHVQCARVGQEVDLARCLECNWLLDLDRTAGTPALRCAAARMPDARESGTAGQHVD